MFLPATNQTKHQAGGLVAGAVAGGGGPGSCAAVRGGEGGKGDTVKPVLGAEKGWGPRGGDWGGRPGTIGGLSLRARPEGGPIRVALLNLPGTGPNKPWGGVRLRGGHKGRATSIFSALLGPCSGARGGGGRPESIAGAVEGKHWGGENNRRGLGGGGGLSIGEPPLKAWGLRGKTGLGNF